MSSDSSGPFLRVEQLRKVYDRDAPVLRWRESVPFIHPKPRSAHPALDGVDLEVRPGESVGIVGPNGSGKSTLLKVIAGITHPTSGTVEFGGSIGALIELGLGFHPELTGWENARASLIMRYGWTGRRDSTLEEIAEFAGIGDAMRAPLKHYSLGMQARLAFAVATCRPVDLLLVDEVLAVGDREFQLRCFDRIATMIEAGTALVFVSHEMWAVSAACQRTVHLRNGRIVDDGPTESVIERYLSPSSSRLPVDEHGPARIGSITAPAQLAPWDRLELVAEVDVDRPLRTPQIGLDFSLPTIAPGLVILSSVDDIAELSAPGSYRITGRSQPLAYENARFRVQLSVVDESRVAASAFADCRLVSTHGDDMPYLALDVDWKLEHVSERSQRTTATPPPLEADDDALVTVDHACKQYRSGANRISLRPMLPGRLGASRHFGERPVHALDQVSLHVHAGEAVGVIGPNGAGKSTLLRAIAGMIRLDSGRVTNRARIVPLFGLDAGFHPDLDGWQNLRTLAGVLGMSRAETDASLDRIVDFAGIGDAMDGPVRHYSSGMRARLGFAVSIHAPGNLLLIDELLAVGDESFRARALDAVAERRRGGTAMMLVSHELRLVELACERVIRLDHGRVVADGPASTVIDGYGELSWAGGVRDATASVRLLQLEVPRRHVGTGEALTFSGEIAVDDPSPDVRLELSYRMIPPDRNVEFTAEQRRELSFLVRSVAPAGALTAVGHYRYEGAVLENAFSGEFDLIISAIDARNNVLLAEAWQEVRTGNPIPGRLPAPDLDMAWRVERIEPRPPATAS